MAINYEPSSARIWVSTSGSDSNSGTQGSPYRTIQHAINKADPGTSIYVKGGTYTETIKVSAQFNPDLNRLTENNSIALISVDGEGAAQIVGKTVNKSTIELLSIKNFVVDGFRIVGNVSSANDEGPVKITGGATIYNNSGNLHFLNNTFAGTGVDGIKVINTSDIHVVGNTFNGNFTQQVMDFVTVSNSFIENNLVIGRADSGVTIKSGSRNFDVTGNHFNFTSTDGGGPAVLVGGEGFSFSKLPAEVTGFEARDILVSNNVVQNSGKFAVFLQGAHNSTISNNFFDNTGDEAIRALYSRSAYGHSDNSGNKIVNNTLTSGLDLYEVQPGAYLGSTVSGTKTGTLGSVTFDYGPDAGGTTAPPTTAPPSTGSVQLAVQAGGTGTDAAAPSFKVVVDGVTIGTRTVDATTGAFNVNNDALYDTFTFQLSKAPAEVEIVYANDGTSSGIDRNLFVDYIAVGGTRHEFGGSGLLHGCERKRFPFGLHRTDVLERNADLRSLISRPSPTPGAAAASGGADVVIRLR